METDAIERVYAERNPLRRAAVLREAWRVLITTLCYFWLALVDDGVAARDRPVPPAGVSVLYRVEDEMFPKSWLTAPHYASARSLEEAELERSAQILVAAMKKYPDRFLDRNLERVYVLAELRFDSIEAAGTNSVDRVYLVNGGDAAGFSDRFIEETFHHELSSVLLRRYRDRFSDEAWMKAVPDHVRYGNSGVDAVKKGEASLTFEERLHKDGFIHEYSMATLEDDFNSIAENLFSSQDDFWRIVDRYPVLAKKVRLVIDFYHALDPVFTEAYFRSLGRKVKPGPVEV